MIFTFYSYKGGVGRSMALANMAELFYRAGLKVLMIDWDLESPGLETFFFDAAQMDDILSQLGLMDMLLAYKEQMTQPWSVTDGEVLQLPELEDFVTKIPSGGAGEGDLCLLTAGERSAENFGEYAQSVITFDWQDFYQNWEGERYIEWLRQQLEQRYDVILIDSRTGVTEMGGICTYHLADVITMFCAPNRQNLYGSYNMAQKFTDPIWPSLRQQRPLKVLIVPSRIERAESHFLDNFQNEFISRFQEFVPYEEGIDIKQLWELAIPYIPKYVYQETIAVRESDLASAEDLATAYRELWEVLARLRLSHLVCQQPDAVADELALAFARLDHQKDKAELARIASLVERFSPQLALCTDLLIYARSMANVARNNLESAAAQLKNAFGEQEQVEIRGINLAIPQWIFDKPSRLSIPAYRPHPFIYGRPVRASEFLNREEELRTIFNRLQNGESTVIIGGPRLGKTSLLLKVADESTLQAYLGDSAQNLQVCILEMHFIGRNYTPALFWEEALEPLGQDYHQIISQLEKAVDSGYTSRALQKLFRHLGQQGRRLVLLLDDFDRLLSHANFKERAFFALLGSLATRSAGLVLLLASRFSVAEMNDFGRQRLGSESPLFNYFIEIRLRPFDQQSIALLLEQAGKTLSSDERRFIRRVAGPHPFLLQAMAASMVLTTGDDRPARAAERFYRQVTFYFDDLWYRLENRTRTAAVILSVIELASQALGRSNAYYQLEDTNLFMIEIRDLAELGLVEQVGQEWPFDREHLFVWRGEQWTIGTQAFIWWLYNEIKIIFSYKDDFIYDWESYYYITDEVEFYYKDKNIYINEEFSSEFQELYNDSLPIAARGVRELAQALWNELVTQK